MREIKFRAWDIMNKMMINCFALSSTGNIMFTKKRGSDGKYHYSDLSNQGYNNERFVLMQYTGLKDKNGKEIYEGDIIRRDDGILSVHFGSSAFGLSVHRSDGVFASQWQLYGGKDKGEIIGNIYENPDLLTH